MTQTYSYCERPTAGPTSPVHIRVVGPEGRLLGGGITGKALCGLSLNHGWDLPGPVVEEEKFCLDEAEALTPGRTHVACSRAFRAGLDG